MDSSPTARAVKSTDQQVIDRIAALLSSNDWRGADFCEWIADLVGEMRPHPGQHPAGAYPLIFKHHTGRDLPRGQR